MIGQTVSHYRIQETLGRGGMGVVYKAEDTRLRRPVALKFLSEELSRDSTAVERFQREARAASALNHPHICAVYDIGEHAGRHFIVMEFLQGAALQQHIGSKPLPTQEILELGIQIADALEAAHDRRIIHRDIKPANIFVTERGQAKLLDFGLAKPPLERHPATALPTEEQLTGAGAILGTLAYMSPEQVRGEPLDARTDLFSLGAVLYEMTTGRQAFDGSTSGTICDAILNRAPVPVVRVNPASPPKLDDVINKALEKDRQLRYQTASELRTDLQRLKRDSASANVTVPDTRDGTAGPRPWWRGGPAKAAAMIALVAAAAAGIHFAVVLSRGTAIDSIAVLPFVNGSGDSDAEYLSDGITESLINNLSQLPKLRVTARSTVFRYKGQETDPRRIGQDLRVRAVLSGRLLQRGDTLIVRTELMDVANGAQLWGGQYNRKTADVFALQDELSTEISNKLRLRLTNEERQQLTRRYTDSPEAYALYLKGRYYWNKRSVEGLQKSVEYLHRAVQTDPGYALAHAGLADSYNLLSFFNVIPPRDAMPKAKAAATKALEIDSNLAEAHVALGYGSFTYDWDWPAATRHFDRAIALNRESVMNHNYYPFYLSVAGRFDEAISTARQTSDRDPGSAALSHTLAVQLILSRRFDEAIAESDRTITLDPSFAVAYEVTGATFAAKGMLAEALRALEKAAALNGGTASTLAHLGHVRARLGDRAGAQRILDQLHAASSVRYTPALASAIVHAGLGETDQAFAALEKAYDERFNRLAYLRREPVWDTLRPDPRFKALLKRIDLPD